MQAALPQPSPDDGPWVDVDTLARLRGRADLDRQTSNRYTPEEIEWMARRWVEFVCDNAVSLARMLGGRVDFQNRLQPSDHELDLRVRMHLPGRDPVILEDTQHFIEWMRANKQMLIALAQRAKLAEAVPEIRASSGARARRSL